jgi:hypothetical protein
MGSAILLGACGGGSTTSRTTTTQTETSARPADLSILNNALDLEHLAIAAYTAGIPLLSGDAQKAAHEFLLQELAHASSVATLVKQAGGKPGPLKPSYDLGNPRRPADVLALFHNVERMLIRTYVDAILRVAPGTVRTRLASILTNEAQHLAVVRLELGTPPVPAPIVTGSQ